MIAMAYDGCVGMGRIVEQRFGHDSALRTFLLSLYIQPIGQQENIPWSGHLFETHT